MSGKRKRNSKLDHQRVLSKVSKTIPESTIFQELVEYEKRVDTVLLRKQVIMHDAFASVSSKPLVSLTMSIYNAYDQQKGAYRVEANAATGIPSWTLRIEGQLQNAPESSEKKFTSFFKKIIISLDPNEYPEDNIIEWDRTQDHSLDADGFEIHRAGSQDTTAKIVLQVAYSPPRYKIEKSLGTLLNIHSVESRAKIIVRLWQHVKSHCKVDENDPKLFHLDEALQNILKKETLTFAEMPVLLRSFLSTPDPIEIDYRIKVTGKATENIKSFELLVSDNKQADNSNVTQEIAAIDNKISEIIGQIDEHRTKRDFMVSFQDRPLEVISDLIASQVHKYKILHSDTKEGEATRLSGFYYQPMIKDAVSMYAQRTSLPK